MILSSLTNTVLRSHTKFNTKTTQMIPAMTSTQKRTNVATKKKYWDYKTTARILPSVVCLMNSRSSQFKKLQSVSGWEDSSTNLGKYVGRRPNQMLPSTHPVLKIIQSTPLARSKMTQQTRRAPATTHTTSVDSEDDNIVCDISIQADQARLCQAKQAHDLVLGKADASLAKKCLTASDAPHLNTKSLIQKLDEVAKTVDLDVSTILEEQMKDPVLGTVRSWIRRNTPPDTKSPDIQQSKGLLRYCQEFNRLLIEEKGQLLCCNEPSDKLEEENLRIFLPLSLFLAWFRPGDYNEMGGHMGATKTYANTKRFYHWPGMFDWICALTADCLTCQNNKPKPKHQNEVLLEEWQNKSYFSHYTHRPQRTYSPKKC